mgnify:CR=1 FL=1
MATEHGGDLYDLSHMTDEEIRELVVQQLREYPNVDAEWIDVQVKDGVIDYVQGWPRIEASCKYHRPARLGDDLVVVSTVEAVRGVSVLIHQRVMRGAEMLTDAHVTAAFITADGRPQRQPSEWVERFKTISQSEVADA